MKFQLEIQATLENVTSLGVSKDYRFHITFKCVNCNEEGREPMSFSIVDSIHHGRATVNLAFRCKFCSRQNTAVILEDSFNTYTGETGGYQPLVQLECRGCEPLNFVPYGPWNCVNPQNNRHFEEINLAEDWADFDDDSNEPVSIIEFTSRFERL